jgi:hypothetical protein
MFAAGSAIAVSFLRRLVNPFVVLSARSPRHWHPLLSMTDTERRIMMV